jgi:hypothetical protein
MTLFFVSHAQVRGLGRRMLDEDPHRLVMASDVVVVVDREGQWRTTKDRHDVPGLVVTAAHQAELLQKYYTISRTTNFSLSGQ